MTACSSNKTNEAPQGNNFEENPKIQIEMQDGSTMVLELYPEYAPETVQNFVNLVESEFYNGLTFHRIIEGFMIQGGDPNGDGTGGSGKNIRGEFAENGFSQNTLSHTRGVISMARSKEPNSASSQFFIMHGDEEFLDGKYAAFGKLIEGEETLDKIAGTPVKPNIYSGEVSTPEENIVINKITVLE
ncbi:peptidylprolyl isomerase [Serpentinicella alkaliphila]|nr:peptidylprolyl isomerase [Serpentinicella alkaliphila]QUH27227.1 peptidylprolyl isomerase [Serpentinicella alkaliphila]